MKLTKIYIFLITFLISISANSKSFCEFNGKSQIVGATLGPFICGEKGTWLNKKDVCIYNGKPYTVGTTLSVYVCKSGQEKGEWKNENAVPVEVPIGVNTSHKPKDKNEFNGEIKTVAPAARAVPK
jgi:hypothetical protein